MEKGKSQHKFAKRRADLGVWLGMLGAKFVMNSTGEEELFLSVLDGWYFLKEWDCPDQTGRNDFEVREGRNPRFFMLIFESDRSYMSVGFSCVTDFRTLSNAHKERAGGASASRGYNYFCLFHL